MRATRVTLTVAGLTVLIATPVGVAAAYAITNSSLRIMRLIHLTLMLPLVVRALFGEKRKSLQAEVGPHVARSVAFFLAACRNNGHD